MKKIILAVLLLSSCLTPRQAQDKYGCKEIESKEKSDTIEVLKHDTVTILGDSVTTYLPCDQPKDTVYLKGKGNSSVKAVYNKAAKGYTVVANCDSLSRVIEGKDRIISTYRESIVKQVSERKTWVGRKLESAWNYVLYTLALIGSLWIISKLLTRVPVVGSLLGRL